MLISELAHKSGVGKTTVRFYTSKGLLPHTERAAGSRQYMDYPETAVEVVKNIKRSQALGFTLAEINTILADFNSSTGRVATARHRQLIIRKLHSIQTKKQELSELETSMKHMLAAFDKKHANT